MTTEKKNLFTHFNTAAEFSMKNCRDLIFLDEKDAKNENIYFRFIWNNNFYVKVTFFIHKARSLVEIFDLLSLLLNYVIQGEVGLSDLELLLIYR